MGNRRPRNNPIAVIDLFAGPGGLGEGFDRFRDRANGKCFDVRLSIEKDPYAYATLLLRSFFRQFSGRKVPEKYYEYLRGEIDREALFAAYPAEADQAREKVWHATLGGRGLKHSVVRNRIRLRLSGAKDWVLLGGPPCQAYSIVGRSRMRSTKADADAYEADRRHFLYKEYLRIIADHAPPVFVIENVKGLLSSVGTGEANLPANSARLAGSPKSVSQSAAGNDVELPAVSLFTFGRLVWGISPAGLCAPNRGLRNPTGTS